MAIYQTSIKIKSELMEKVKADAEKEKRSINKQIEYIVEQYYEMKRMLNK